MGITIEQLGRAAYAPTYAAMQAYTAARTEASPDVIWLCEHDAVYTQGLAGKSDHVGNPGAIAVVATNRGGQVTYHGVALNVAMDLEPYARINPCGYAGLRSVDLSTIGVHASWQDVADLFGQKLVAYLAPRN